MPGSRDIALISLGTTPGLRRADDAFREAAERAGVSCDVFRVEIGAAGALRRQITATDLVEATAARRTIQAADARVIVFSTVTTALLQKPDVPYAIRFDSPAAMNRPGLAGAWQRRAERKAMAGAKALLPWGQAAADALPAEMRAKAIPLHVPIAAQPAAPPGSAAEPGSAAGAPDIDALAYAGYPRKRGLDLLIRAWAEVGSGRTLVVAGIERERAEEWLRKRQVPIPENVEWRGLLDRDDWNATLARTRIFVNASRREDHGLSQLEALAAGAMLVTVPSLGAYEALPIARRLDANLVATGIESIPLGRALRAGFDADRDDYAARAAAELAPYSRDAVQRVFEDEVLPALGLR